MRKLILPLLFLLLIVSCKTYTIEEARETIVYPSSQYTPTKLNDIEREKAEKQRQEDAKKTNEYPEDPGKITLPFYYNPVKNKEYTLDESLTQFNVLFIPLGEEAVSEEALESIKTLVDNHPFTLIALSGSLDNQKSVASMLKKDAVTLKGGTIIFDGVVLKEIDDDYIILALTEEKTITIYNRDYHPLFDYTLTEDEILSSIDRMEKLFSEELIESISGKTTEEKILFLSSIAPSSLDWTPWTKYDYREERNFLLSDLLLSLNWIDSYDVSRFSEETECGFTRKYGSYEERLDFIYSKGLITTESYILPVENLDTRAVVAVFMYL